MKPPSMIMLLTAPFLALAKSGSFVAYRNQGLQQGLISPKLEPESDKVFFGPPFPADYPDNDQPTERKISPEFGHPYPALQDTDKFDKDYVKDENGDDGEWQAQMNYDDLRTTVGKDKDDVEKAKAAEEELKKRVEQAKYEESEAGKKAAEAEKKAAKAREEAKQAEKEVAAAKEATEKAAEREAAEEQRQAAERAQTQAGGGKETGDAAEPESGTAAGGAGEKGGAGVKDNSDKIAEAAEKVKKEMSDLEKCQQELADARARLRELQMKEEELARQRREQRELEKAQWEAKLAALAEEERRAAAELAEREKEKREKREDERMHRETLSGREAAHEVADRQYKEEAADYEKWESQLKAAEQSLRKFRGSEAAGGAGRTQMLGGRLGKPNVLKSGAPQRGLCAAMVPLIVVMLV